MDEQTIDLKVLFKVFTQHIAAIIVAAVIAGAAGFVLAFCVIPKTYTSEAMMYVESSATKDIESSININEINAAQKLVNTCQIIFKSNYLLTELNSYFSNDYTIEELDKMISISPVNNTEVLKISVESLSPKKSKNIADKLIELSEIEFKRVIKTGSIELVSPPTVPQSHTFPSVPKFTVIAALAAMVLVYAVFLVNEVFDIRVKPEDDLATMYNIPVFAEVVDFLSADKGGYKYRSKSYSYYSSSSVSGDDADDSAAEHSAEKA